ncbi:MAG: dethiobiotin synthase [Gammaproteobacteria bacterium]
MTHSFFITGTDTDVGKTWVTLGLLQAFNAAGYRTAAMKPVACGVVETSEGLRNEDALLLQRQASVPLSYEDVNPYLFHPPIAPHLAAQDAGVRIDLSRIKALYDNIIQRADIVLVEGAGGWLVPLNEQETSADMVERLSLPVILVVGLRLGCLNHALLTVESIARHNVKLAGWVANCITVDMPQQARNIEALQARISAPLLGTIPYLSALDPNRIATFLRFPDLG